MRGVVPGDGGVCASGFATRRAGSGIAIWPPAKRRLRRRKKDGRNGLDQWDLERHHRFANGRSGRRLNVESGGDTFKGVFASSMGYAEIMDGTVDGDALTWNMYVVVSLAMTVDCKAIVAGNTMIGTAAAALFGTAPLTGTRS